MSRPIYYIGGLIIVALAILGFFLPGGMKERVGQGSIEVSSPVYRSIAWVQNLFSGAEGGFKNIEQLRQELEELRTENARLGAENLIFQKVREENASLKEMLGFRNDSQYKLMAARVVQRDPSNWWEAIIINRGYNDDPDLAPDQPVISPRGVIGKTSEVGRYSTRVTLIIDENCKISAVTESSRSQGVVGGETAMNGGVPLCKLSFVNRDAQFQKGERVFTTGLGGVFPSNLLIGVVSEAPPLSTERNFGLYREGTVQPTADLNNLGEVFVILGVK